MMGIYKRKKRAERRNHVKRIKAKIMRCPACKEQITWSDDEKETKKALGIRAKTQKLCSGYCCGNRRKYDGISLNEKRINQREE
ncbi:MAG: hypothetical protein KAS32_12745 [Candidatus Peribacteraceae bacterium]|nr:hypothetical protein [Candidatus Peribacteraceae bacterium]